MRNEASQEAQQLCAECLGLLGAIDPARLLIKAEPLPALHTSLKQLLLTLLEKHLIRLLRVASSLQLLNFATFAIQVHHITDALRFATPRLLQMSFTIKRLNGRCM